MDDHFANLSDGNTEKLQYREVKKPDISSSKTFVPTTIIRNKINKKKHNRCKSGITVVQSLHTPPRPQEPSLDEQQGG